MQTFSVSFNNDIWTLKLDVIFCKFVQVFSWVSLVNVISTEGSDLRLLRSNGGTCKFLLQVSSVFEVDFLTYNWHPCNFDGGRTTDFEVRLVVGLVVGFSNSNVGTCKFVWTWLVSFICKGNSPFNLTMDTDSPSFTTFKFEFSLSCGTFELANVFLFVFQLYWQTV